MELEFTGLAPLAEPGLECPEGTIERARVTVRDGQIVEITEAE